MRAFRLRGCDAGVFSQALGFRETLSKTYVTVATLPIEGEALSASGDLKPQNSSVSPRDVSVF